MRNLEKFMLVVAFLTANQHLLSANMKQVVAAKKARPVDSELFIRAAITAGGTINLLEGLTTQTTGITNFDGNKLGEGRYFVADAITVNYGIAAAGTAVHAVNYISALPPALKAANLILKQEGHVITRLPISAINDAKNSDMRYRELGAFELLLENKIIEFLVQFPPGSDLAPPAGNDGYMEILLRGFETYSTR